jgi:hypothetical protein
VVYFFWPETAGLSLEEVAQNFGDEVVVHMYDAKEGDRTRLDEDTQVQASGMSKPGGVETVHTDV